MRFLIDAQLPPALARLLASRGHTAEHVGDIGLRDSGDCAIWDYALRHQAVILTKDEDFPLRQSRSRTAPCIVWIRAGNTSRKALLQWFDPLLPRIIQLIQTGERLVEVR